MVLNLYFMLMKLMKPWPKPNNASIYKKRPYILTNLKPRANRLRVACGWDVNYRLLHRHWQRLSRSLLTDRFVVVGGHPGEHMFDLRPLPLRRIGSVGVDYDKGTDSWGDLKGDNLRLRRSRRLNRQRIPKVYLPGRRNKRRKRLRILTYRRRRLRIWTRPRVTITIPPLRNVAETWARYRNRSFMHNFKRDKKHINSVFSKRYLFYRSKRKFRRFRRSKSVSTRINRAMRKKTWHRYETALGVSRARRRIKSRLIWKAPVSDHMQHLTSWSAYRSHDQFGDTHVLSNRENLLNRGCIIRNTTNGLLDTVLNLNKYFFRTKYNLSITGSNSREVRISHTRRRAFINQFGIILCPARYLLCSSRGTTKQHRPRTNKHRPRTLSFVIFKKQNTLNSLLITTPLSCELTNEKKTHSSRSELRVFKHLTLTQNKLLGSRVLYSPTRTSNYFVTNTPPTAKSSVYRLFAKVGRVLSGCESWRTRRLNRPEITSRRGTNLSLHFAGFFIGWSVKQTRQKYFRFAYIAKKVYFSFLAPNQVKRNIMFNRKRILVGKLALNIRRYSKPWSRFSYTYFSNMYKLASTLGRSVDTFRNNTLNTSDLFTKHRYRSGLLNYAISYHTLDDVVDSRAFNNKGHGITRPLNEVRISRIKFKPGYQRIWRRVRNALKDSLRLRFIYQKQLTNYLTKFYDSSRKYALSQDELSFDKVVVYSRLLPDMITCKVFIESGLLYLNGNLVFDGGGYTTSGDVIQITTSIWYYILSRWLFNWTNQRNKKFRRMVYRKGLAARYKVMKTRKQRSYYTPNWVYNNRYDMSDTKPYLEVDYFSLSAVVLYDPYILDHHLPNDRIDVRTNIYKLYNWKYIN